MTGDMVQEKAHVMAHRRVAPHHFLMRLSSPAAARRARPGQFVHVRCRENGEYFPLLRRPLSLFDADPAKGTIDFIYKVVGSGTQVLSQARVGSRVDFLGPLGNPFTLPTDKRTCWLVGGGVGIPPLYLLAKWLLRRNRRVTALLGARTKGWVICAKEFRALGIPVRIATDDGSAGRRGSVVELLENAVSFPRKRESRFDPRVREDRFREDDITLYICGPTPMMAAAAAVARRRGIEAQVSLEERMGCAMGCCMGCVVEVRTEPVCAHARFQRVCTEGPVFPAEAIRW